MYSYKKGVSQHLEALIKDCIKKCEEADIPISKNITFDVMKGEKVYGHCTSWRKTDQHIIEISKYLVNEEEIKNTIIHELLHSCPDGKGHGARWQYYGSIIQKKYGYIISRCDSKKVVCDIYKSRRTYYTKDEYLANKDILVALAIEGDSQPRWYVKKTSKIMTSVLRGTCRTSSTYQKIIIFKEEVK